MIQRSVLLLFLGFLLLLVLLFFLLDLFHVFHEVDQLLQGPRFVQEISQVDLALWRLFFCFFLVNDPVAKQLLGECAYHVEPFAILLPVDLRVLAVPADVTSLETLVTLSRDSRIIHTGLAALDGQPLWDVLPELNVDEDAVDLDAVGVDQISVMLDMM